MSSNERLKRAIDDVEKATQSARRVAKGLRKVAARTLGVAVAVETAAERAAQAVKAARAIKTLKSKRGAR